jgi:putative hemolysin
MPLSPAAEHHQADDGLRQGQAAENGDDISYASPGDPFLKRLVIRAIERASGQRELKRMYLERKHHPVAAESFWDAAVRKLRLTIDFNVEALAEIPTHGPVVIVANHPFGVIDGLVACWLVARVRTDFKVLAHALLYRAVEVRPFLLPIDFEETKSARETNVESRAEATALLKRGGALIVFPSGMVSTTPTVFAGRAVDPDWKPFAARMIMQSKAPVVPIFFRGQNSCLFQVVSHFSMTLRLSLLLKEAHDRIGAHIALRIGTQITFEELAAIRDRKELMKSLRDRTYTLAQV